MVRQAVNNKKRDKPVDKRSPTANISKIGSLKKFSDLEYANSLLHQVAKLVAPILHMNNFKVGTLCEMYPKNPNLLGLNVNRGQKILIRLRYHSNERLFYPLGDIIGTMLHELTHNIYGPHDAKFYKFLDGLKKDFENIQYGSLAKTNYVCEEQTLGSAYNPRGGCVSVRDKRIAALSAHKFKSEARRLGNSSSRINKPSLPSNPEALRKLILDATERRIKDAKWCPTEVDTKDIEPGNEDLDIVVVDNEEDNTPEMMPELNGLQKPTTKVSEYKEVIDLTNDEYEGGLLGEDEIIVIEGCEKGLEQGLGLHEKESTGDYVDEAGYVRHDREEPTRILHRDSLLKSHFPGLLPPLEENSTQDATNDSDKFVEASESVQYSFSPSSGRTFIFEGNDKKYPRRKLVADLDFEQILKKGDKINITNPLPLLHEEISLDEEESILKNHPKQENHPKLKPAGSQTNADHSKAKDISLEPTSEKHKKEPKRRKGVLRSENEDERNAKKVATNLKKSAKKSHKQVLNKKTVKSMNFDDLLSNQ